jgi:hypothetical protein
MAPQSEDMQRKGGRCIWRIPGGGFSLTCCSELALGKRGTDVALLENGGKVEKVVERRNSGDEGLGVTPV